MTAGLAMAITYCHEPGVRHEASANLLESQHTELVQPQEVESGASELEGILAFKDTILPTPEDISLIEILGKLQAYT